MFPFTTRTFPTTIKFIRDTVKKYADKYPNSIYPEPVLIPPKKPWNDILSQNGYPMFSKQVSVLINRIRNAKTKNSVVKWCFGIDKDKTSTSKYKLSESRLFLLDNRMILGWKELIEKDEELKQYFPKYDEYYFVSEKCCDYVKGGLKHDRHPSFIGVMAEESEMRKKSWIKSGCNIFGSLNKKSRPLSIWNSNDVWQYARDNKLEINPAYNFDPSIDIDKQELRFERLGCTSCPFGSLPESKIIERLEKNLGHENYHEVITDKKYMNRFEKLKEYYPHLYDAQIIKTGMYKIIIDMDVPIRNDETYMKLYHLRREQINKWYENKRENVLRVMAQLENINDYKHKGESYVWEFTNENFEDSAINFDIKKYSLKEIKDIRKEEQEFYNTYVKPIKCKTKND